MSKSIKIAAIVALAGLVSACGNRNQDEVVMVMEPVPEPAPITIEPVFTGKYK